jgi:PAS domain S-box-containing protein
MSMYRLSPPEYHALVVENERDFRKELIYTVESMDIGISVAAEASSFEEALQLLEDQAFDLLIADINLTDEPRFRVGNRDGIALACHARERWDIPCIFLTAFADHDPEVIEKASACDPIGFIRKQYGDLGAATQHLIRLAMRHLELLRSEREYARQLRALLRHMGDALLYIDQDGQVLDFDRQAATLLGLAPDEMIDQHWEDVLCIDKAQSGGVHALRELLTTGGSGQIPALVIRRPDARQVMIALFASPAEHLREPCSLLVLRDLHANQLRDSTPQYAGPATMVVFGVRQTGGAAAVEPVQMHAAMLALRAGLVARARHDDILGNPTPLTLALQLPGLDIGSGLATASTLLADLQILLQRDTVDLRLHAGVAYRDSGHSHIGALAAAIDALDRAQRSGESVCCASGGASVIRDADALAELPPEGSSLARAFLFTERLLDITPQRARSPQELADQLQACLATFTTMHQFALLRVVAGNRLQTVLRRNLRSGAARGDGDIALPIPMRQVLDTLDLQSVPDLSFHPQGDHAVTVFALRHQQRLNGLCLGLWDSSPRGVRPARPIEEHLARIGGEHLSRLLDELYALSTISSSDGQPAGADYNLHDIAGEPAIVEEIQWLLRLDTPVAIVGETGLAKTQLAKFALANSGLQFSTVHVLNGEQWPSPEHQVELNTALQLAHCALIIRNPQAMHPRLQQTLGEALRSRTLSTGSPPRALPSASYITVMTRSPAELASRGEMAAELASALGAGTVHIAPLRADLRTTSERATRLLSAESVRQGRTGTGLSREAVQAIREHGWPGNLRELQDRIRSALARSPRGELSDLDLGLYRLSVISQTRATPAGTAHHVAAPDAAQLSGVVRALAPVLDIASRLDQPPPLADWMTADAVELSLERFLSDRAPFSRAAEFLRVAEPTLRTLSDMAAASSGSRQATRYWQGARLALRSRVMDGSPFPINFQHALRHCMLSLLAVRSMPVGSEQGARILGLTPAQYLDELRALCARA